MNAALQNVGGWAGAIGWIGAFIGPFLVYLSTRRRTDVDESTMVLAAWKNLVEQHQSDIKGIRDEFAAYKASALAEITDLRDRLRNAESRITELETENAGLKRAIAQNSRSSAYLLGGKQRRNSDPGEDLE